MRWGWVELIEDLVEGLPFAGSVEELNQLVDKAVAEMALVAEYTMAGIMANRAGEEP